MLKKLFAALAALTLAAAPAAAFAQAQANTGQLAPNSGWLVMGKDGSNLAQPLPISGGALVVSSSGGTGANQVQGNVASGASDTGTNPVKIGGVFNTTQPTVTTGQRVDWQMTNRGAGFVSLEDQSGNIVAVSVPSADGQNAGQTLSVSNYSRVFNGTTFDRLRDATSANATTGTGLQGAGVLGKYNATLPTYTDGQYGNLQLDPNGALRTKLITVAAAGADGVANRVGYALGGDQTTTNTLQVAPVGFNGTTFDRIRTVQATSDVTSGLGVAAVAQVPNSSAGSAASFTATGAVASNLVAKASAGNLYAMNVTAGASALFIMVFDATSAPADGAVTPKWCLPLAANAGLDKVFNPPLRGATGLTIVASTTGCYTKTASATAFISAQAQ